MCRHVGEDVARITRGRDGDRADTGPVFQVGGAKDAECSCVSKQLEIEITGAGSLGRFQNGKERNLNAAVSQIDYGWV